MLDENLPTYRFRPSSDDPFHTLLYFSHQGSDPTAEYLFKRPVPSTSKNQYALGLLDAQYSSVIYAEVALKPEWSQPTLSAAEVRAAGNNAGQQVAVTPETFTISLYNPDQSFVVKQQHGSWGKTDGWEFEIPERTFKVPSASRIDQDSPEAPVADLIPKVMFRWKRTGRLSRDMTCYMCGRSVGGKKSKEPDITVAMFHGKNDAALTIYEPNMRRVEVEDRKGLEMVLLMSAEVIRDLYLSPRQDPFNTAGAAPPVSSGRRRTTSSPVAAMSGAIGNHSVPTPEQQHAPSQPANDARRKAEVEAETKRLQAMVAEEERQERERRRREQEEEKRIQLMLKKEEEERRKREAEIDKETERLRREYGVDGQNFGASPTSPPLPPRSNLSPTLSPGGWGMPALPPRPNSVGPMSPPQPYFAAPPQPQPNPPGGKKARFSQFLGAAGGNGRGSGSGPYGGPAAASVSGFFGRGDDGRKKVQKKRSVHF